MRIGKLFLIAGFLVVVVVGFFFKGRCFQTLDANDNTLPSVSSNTQPDNSVDEVSSSTAAVDYFPLQNSVNNERLVQEINELHKNDVLGMSREDSDYATYSDTALEELAHAGDVIAMKMLALRYQQLVRDIEPDKYPAFREKLNSLYNKAIVYGDRELLTFMPGLRDAQNRISDPRLTAEQKHQAAIDLLAHTEFMGLRGALKQKYTDQIEAFEIYPEFGFPLTLTKADKQLVREKAKDIYHQYEKQRLELGLGPFDNSVPEELSKVYEYERRIYELKMGDNAI